MVVITPSSSTHALLWAPFSEVHFTPLWHADTLFWRPPTRVKVSAIRCASGFLCLPSCSFHYFFLPPFSYCDSSHADRQGIKVVTLSYLMALMCYSALCEHRGALGHLGGIIWGIFVSVWTLRVIKSAWNASLFLVVWQTALSDAPSPQAANPFYQEKHRRGQCLQVTD